MRTLVSSCLVFFLSVIPCVLLPTESCAQTDETYGLAVLDLQAIGISETEAKALSDMLRSSIAKIIVEKSDKTKDSYNLIERSQMDKIFDQFEVQNTGCTDLSCAVEFGKMLNVERIIIGSVSLVGSTYMVIARIVDVESSRTLASVDRKQRGIIDNVIDLMPLVGHELLTGERLAAPVPETPSPSTQVTPSPVTTSPQTADRPREQYLSVSGTPEAAEVFLDDEKIGVTPIDYRKVNPGRYMVKIVRKGYEDFEDEIVVRPGGNESFTYRLTPHAVLSFSGSPDDATVYIEGTAIGKTPIVEYEVSQGTYAVKITRDGFLDFEKNVSVSSGQEREISYTLTALETLSVEGIPAGAYVYIDRKKIGQTPLRNHVIPEGDYRLRISHSGYENSRETVTVRRGRAAEISYYLVLKTKGKVLRKSLVLPGSGQWYAEYRGRGALITVLQLATLSGVVVTSLNASSAWDDYDEAESAYKNAGFGAGFDSLYRDIEEKHDKASSAATLQKIAVGVAAAVYAYNVVDALITEPKIDSKPGFNSLIIEPRIGSGQAVIIARVRF